MTFDELIIDDLLFKIEKQNQKIGEMQKEIERLHKVFDIKDEMRIELVKENTTLKNDYKKCYAENVRLSEENKQLKFRNKMLINTGINSVYGINCCKNHWVYTDTDSIKSESEDNKHDSNN